MWRESRREGHQCHPEDPTLMTSAVAKSLQSCLTLCNPIDGSPQGSPSLGFSRQELWSRLPIPSPMQKSESEVSQSCPTLSDPMDCKPTRLLRPGDFPGKSTGVGCHWLLHSWPHPTLIISQRPYLQMSSQWGLEFQHMNWRGTQMFSSWQCLNNVW